MLQIVAIGVGVLVLVVVAAVVATVDDWSRDLAQNHAATQLDAADPDLRPLAAPVSLAAADAVIRQAVDGLRHWSTVSTERWDDSLTYHFVRTTPLFRFKDDIQVTVLRTDMGVTIEAESQSHLGRGDFGQNPRNLKELLRAVREGVGGEERIVE